MILALALTLVGMLGSPIWQAFGSLYPSESLYVSESLYPSE